MAITYRNACVFPFSTCFLHYFFIFFSHTFTFQLLDMPWSQVSSLLPPGSCLQFLLRIGFSNPTARPLFHRMMLTHALALSASQFVHEKKSQRIYASMHSAGLELMKLTYTRLEDNLIRHRGDRCVLHGYRSQQRLCFLPFNLIFPFYMVIAYRTACVLLISACFCMFYLLLIAYRNNCDLSLFNLLFYVLRGYDS